MIETISKWPAREFCLRSLCSVVASKDKERLLYPVKPPLLACSGPSAHKMAEVMSTLPTDHGTEQGMESLQADRLGEGQYRQPDLPTISSFGKDGLASLDLAFLGKVPGL